MKLIMTKLSEVICGSGQKNEMQESALSSCDDQYQNHQIGDPYCKTVFQCPKKCEGDKTYNVPGNCPVCNMKLEQVAEVHQQYYL